MLARPETRTPGDLGEPTAGSNRRHGREAGTDRTEVAHRARASPSTVSGIEVSVPRVNQPTSGGFVRAARTTWAVPSASTVTSWMWMSSVLVVS